MKKKSVLKTGKGFTLIELLVVVLIIGILTAIALPKYLVAVEKAKAASVMQAGNAIFDAKERYFLNFGSYPLYFKDLDLDFSWQTPDIVFTNGTERYRDETNGYYLSYGGGPILLIDKGNQTTYNYIFLFCSVNKKIYCVGSKDADDKLCKSLGGVSATLPTGCTNTGNRTKIYRL